MAAPAPGAGRVRLVGGHACSPPGASELSVCWANCPGQHSPRPAPSARGKVRLCPAVTAGQPGTLQGPQRPAHRLHLCPGWVVLIAVPGGVPGQRQVQGGGPPMRAVSAASRSSTWRRTAPRPRLITLPPRSAAPAAAPAQPARVLERPPAARAAGPLPRPGPAESPRPAPMPPIPRPAGDESCSSPRLARAPAYGPARDCGLCAAHAPIGSPSSTIRHRPSPTVRQ